MDHEHLDHGVRTMVGSIQEASEVSGELLDFLRSLPNLKLSGKAAVAYCPSCSASAYEITAFSDESVLQEDYASVMEEEAVKKFRERFPDSCPTTRRTLLVKEIMES